MEKEEIPFFFELLSKNDQDKYINMKENFSKDEFRHNRNRSLDTFLFTLQQIRDFCTRNSSEDWKRYLVCGICWLNDSIMAINTSQLKHLIKKSKSSINSCLNSLGFETETNNHLFLQSLCNLIPFLSTKPLIVKQWTIRKKIKKDFNINKPIKKKSCCDCCGPDGTCSCFIVSDILSKDDNYEKPCRCVFPDESYEIGINACACVQPLWKADY